MNDFTIIITGQRVQITFPSRAGRVVPLPPQGRQPVARANPQGKIDASLEPGRYVAVMVAGGRDVLRKEFEVAPTPVAPPAQWSKQFEIAGIIGRRGGDRGYTMDERIALLRLTDSTWVRDFHELRQGAASTGERDQAAKIAEYLARGIGCIVTITPPVVRIASGKPWPAPAWNDPIAIADKIAQLYPAHPRLIVTLINEPEHEWPEESNRCRYWPTADFFQATLFAVSVAKRLPNHRLATPCLTTRHRADYEAMGRLIASQQTGEPLFEFVDLHLYTASDGWAAQSLAGADEAARIIGAKGLMLSEAGVYPSMFASNPARMIPAWRQLVEVIAPRVKFWGVWMYSTSANPAFKGTPAMIAPNLADVSKSTITEYGQIVLDAQEGLSRDEQAVHYTIDEIRPGLKLDAALCGAARAQAQLAAADSARRPLADLMADMERDDPHGGIFHAATALIPPQLDAVRSRLTGPGIAALTDQFSMGDALAAWERSPSHVSQIREPAATHLGVGCATFAAQGTTIVVARAFFGRAA